jgi:transposase, IS5 family
MKPKAPVRQAQRELFRVELDQLVDPGHALVKLGRQINWAGFDESLGQTYAAANGAPGVSTRLMVALHYLKYQHDLSDEAVVAQWVENPYWQHFSGEQFFQHEMPIDPSSMTRWRKRLGEAGAEAMLKETIETGLRLKMITPAQIQRVNVDTTVQTKAVRFPTDARLYNRARERLVKTARKLGLQIKQSYERVGPRLLMQQNRCAHARQPKRAAGCTRKLRTHLGRVIRQIERQQATPTGQLGELLTIAKQIHAQQRQDKNKVYSVHEPKVACIAKGKAGKKYEFGNKVSVATTSRGGWLLGALSLPDNPYDGHTLDQQLAQTRRLLGVKAPEAPEAHVDMGYRGHNHTGPETVHIDKRRRGSTPKSLWRWMKRRAAVEPTIGHMKSEHRLERNRLKGSIGDAINALLSAAAMNFQKLLGFFLHLWLRLCSLLWLPPVISISSTIA